MKKNDWIYIAGHNGLVGSSIYKLLKTYGFRNLIIVDRKKLDLRNSNKVDLFFITIHQFYGLLYFLI